jgi:hypothetical protein
VSSFFFVRQFYPTLCPTDFAKNKKRIAQGIKEHSMERATPRK